MRLGLIKHKQGLFVWVCRVENVDGCVELLEKLLGVPPWIAVRTRVDYLACITSDFSMFISDDKSTVDGINKVGDVDETSTAFLSQRLFAIA